MSDQPKPLTRSELEIIIKRRASLWIVVMAALLACNMMFGGSNSSKIMNNTVAANSLWAWRGEKKIDAKMHEIMAKVIAADGVPQNDKLIGEFVGEAQRLRHEPEEGMDALTKKARKLEDERAIAQAKSPYYTYAGMVMQLALVLSTASILAVAMSMFYASLAVGTVGSVLFAIALVI